MHPEAQKYTRRVKRRKEIERAKIKEEREGEKLSKMAALLVYICLLWIITIKYLLDGRGLFGSKVFKNPARYNWSQIRK